MWFDHVIFLGGLGVVAWVFALVEIHVEGRHGWAANLPTWRIENRWTRIFYGSRALTGYHLYVQLFVTLLLHAPYALGLVRPGWAVEARILSFAILFWVVEDFLWFVINPAFGIRKFAAKHIPWHAPTWWLFMPRDYWLLTPIALALYWFSWRS